MTWQQHPHAPLPAGSLKRVPLNERRLLEAKSIASCDLFASRLLPVPFLVQRHQPACLRMLFPYPGIARTACNPEKRRTDDPVPRQPQPRCNRHQCVKIRRSKLPQQKTQKHRPADVAVSDQALKQVMSEPLVGRHLGRIGGGDQRGILLKIKRSRLTPETLLGRCTRAKKESLLNQGDSGNRQFRHA